MEPINFCYFLKGMLEITEPITINAKQTLIIKDHLKLVINGPEPVVIDRIQPINKKQTKRIKISGNRGSGSGTVMC